MNNGLILQPVVSEKSYKNVDALNKYAFFVDKDASKQEIAKNVEKQYKVKVISVRTVVKPGKLKRDWRSYDKYRRTDLKKAYVTLKKGDKIADFISA